MQAVSEHLQHPKIRVPGNSQLMVTMACSGYGPFIILTLTLLTFQQILLIIRARQIWHAHENNETTKC